jgi:protein-S-isoprenylcysteine O-methyltransferase Ste14
MKNVISLFRSVNIPFFLDIIERTVAAAFFSFFALRFLEAYLETGHVFLLCQLIAELLVIGFLLVRRFSSQVSLNPVDWCMAVAGTSLPLLVAPGGEPLVSSSLAVSIMLAGLLINFWAKFSLRRSFGIVAANRGVKTKGPYSLIRHPMYFGYVVTHIGFLLSNPTFHNLLVYSAALACQIYRIRAEERALSPDPHYQSYSAEVRYRLVPGVF